MTINPGKLKLNLNIYIFPIHKSMEISLTIYYHAWVQDNLYTPKHDLYICNIQENKKFIIQFFYLNAIFNLHLQFLYVCTIFIAAGMTSIHAG